MPFIIESILPQNQSLATVNENYSIQDAISTMIERDFSQLLVVDGKGKFEGFVTSDSIVRALSFCKTTVDKIQVSHAIVQVKSYKLDDGLSDLLNSLKDVNAVAIVDSQDCPKAVVTSYDAAEFFRTKAEDIFLAEDIELTLRDFIESCFKDSDGRLDGEALQSAIMEITPSGEEAKRKFKTALRQYLGQCGTSAHEFDNQLADRVFENHLYRDSPVKQFGELTLFEYIQLFKNVWNNYENNFGNISWASVNAILDSARITRNALAHFREITPQQRELLKYCAGFLDRHRPSFVDDRANATSSQTHDAPVVANSDPQEAPSTTDLASLYNLGETSQGRYTPLALWLQNCSQTKVTLSFEDVEVIIGDTLPASARKHRNWWANDSVSHSQSQQWLEVGWRVAGVNLSEERVVFAQISDRKAAYTSFFNSLQPKLEAISDLSVKLLTNPQGGYWVTFEVSAENAPVGIYHVSFARGAKLYIGQYIAMADRTHTEQIFDHLYQHKTAIEADFGGPLTWEKLIGQQGARVAVYRDNSAITDPPETWEAMQTWLVETLPGFYHAFAPRYQAALDATQPPSSPSA